MKRLVPVLIAVLTLGFTSFTHAQQNLTMSLTGVEPGSKVAIGSQQIVDFLTKDMGVKIKVACMTGNRSMNMLKQGKLDGDIARLDGFDKILPGLVKVEEAASYIPYLAYAKDQTLKINGWESLRSYKVAYFKGMKQVETKLAGHPHLMPVNSVRQGLKMVLSGRADVFPFSPALVEPVLQSDEFKTSGLAALKPPVAMISLYIYVQPQHAELAKKLGAELARLKADGTYAKLTGAK
ncbi:MAG: transporter substrate-binding domain-containing protein [Desulfobacterales bacterium]|nr:transporter substrate-binding domain-containing protein [Desulfobacterales bacterium]